MSLWPQRHHHPLAGSLLGTLAATLLLTMAGCPESDPPADTDVSVTDLPGEADAAAEVTEEVTPDTDAQETDEGAETSDDVETIEDDADTVTGDDGGLEVDAPVDVPTELGPDVEPQCGDGIQQGDEACDDGVANSDTLPDACRTSCELAACGDGVVDSDEDCDDENSNPFDGCDNQCKTAAVVAVPAPGEVVITELMVNPTAVGDPQGEWIELVNVASTTVSLAPCVIRDEGTDIVTLDDVGNGEGLTLDPGQRVLLAFDGVVDGGGAVDMGYTTMLLDNLADEVVVDCGGTVIDAVSYNSGTWPVVAGTSLSLDPGKTAADNDVSFSWCVGATAFGAGDLGTPGAANDVCPPPDVTIDACELVSEATATGFVDQEFSLTVRFMEAGVTELTTGNDPQPDIWAEVGFGPAGSDPATDGTWSWAAAAPLTDWEDPMWDGHQGAFVATAEATVDAAARVTRDGGLTWTYCDRVSDGAYVATDALALTVVADPCDSVVCDTPPADFCESDQLTLQSHPQAGVCSPTGAGMFDCAYAPVPINCGDQGVSCSAGACQGTVSGPVNVGELVVTEVMVRPSIDDYLAEWFEIRNTTDAPLNLSGCAISDTNTDLHTVSEDLIVGPGRAVAIGRSPNPLLNGGIDFPYVVNDDIVLDLVDSLIIDCGGVEIDAVAWTSSWPHKKGVAMSLSPYADQASGVLNDDIANWCQASTLYGTGEAGSPGEANPPCPGDEIPVNSCTLVGDAQVTMAAGVTTTVNAWLVQPGVTDQTDGTDPDPSVVLQVGYGVVDSSPEGWTWSDAQVDATWDATEAGVATNVDGYVARLRAPAVGTWDLAYRASVDGGNTWTLCDRDSSDNGFSQDQVIEVISEASACSPDPCGAAPATVCDGDVVGTPNAASECSLAESTLDAVCFWPSEPTEDCTIYGAECVAGACANFPQAPVAGEVLISEVLVAPTTAANHEWVELYNASAATVVLDGCELQVDGGASWAFPVAAETPLLMPPGTTVLAARDAAAVANPDVLFAGIAFGNSSGQIALACGGSIVNQVNYSVGDGWPVVAGASMQVSLPWVLAASNDVVGKWCSLDASTPGESNSACPAPDAAIDDCQLLAPLDVSVDAGTATTLNAQVLDLGVTDATSGVDMVPGFVAQIGYGADGSDPAADAWTWFDAAPTADWDDATAPGQDGWSADVVSIDDVGTFDVAARFSADGGQTWLYCDSDGAANGYSAGASGDIEVLPTACTPNPCTAPDAPVCQDANIVITAPVGTCTVDEGAPVCDYATENFDCTDFGGCAAATCAGLVAPTVAGEVVITELLTDSADQTPDLGEFIELYNPTTSDFDLRGCVLSDGGTDTHTIGGDLPVILAAGGFAVLASNPDEATNGGLDAVTYFYDGIILGNIVDELFVGCGGMLVDGVSWTVGWPLTEGASMTLSSTIKDSVGNDDAAAWCEATSSYGDGSNLGSPGAENGTCGL